MNLIKFLSLSIFLILLNFQLVAQKFSNIYFEKLPQDLQLYPRNAQNESDIEIKGFVDQNSISKISVLVLRNGEVFSYFSQNLFLVNNKRAFNFYTKINAELAEFDFHFYSHQNNSDSSLVIIRKNVVSGDVYLITGQSNSYNGVLNSDGQLGEYVYKGEFARSFGVFNSPDNFKDYNPADTLWNYSNITNAVGMWGTELQKLIIEKYQIPVCIINGGSGGSSSEYNAIRDANNPAALNTAYGRLLYRVKKAGLENHINGFFYRQGENEADGATLAWKPNFEKIYENLKIDLPSIKKLYLFQNNIYTFPNKLSGVLRDHQRTIQLKYSDLTVLSTVGTDGFDGIHYSTKGYVQTANEVFRIVENDFYFPISDYDIYSPNIQFAYFINEKTELVLQFDQSQEMTFDSTEQKYEESIRQFFKLDDGSFPVSAKAIGNKVFLKLNKESQAKAVSYMPAFMNDGELGFPNYDNLLYNSLKMRPLTFDNFPINPQAVKPEITASKTGENVLITCKKIAGAVAYRLQYRHKNQLKFQSIILLNENQITNFLFRFEAFYDSFKYNPSIDIRMFAINYDGTETDFSNIVHIDFYLEPPIIEAAKSINENDVELTLKNSISSELKYLVQYSMDSYFQNSRQDSAKITSSNKILVLGLLQGQKYYFKVRTVNHDKALFSQFSESFELTTILAKPVGLSVTNKTSNGFVLNWNYDLSYSYNFLNKDGNFVIELSSDSVNFVKVSQKSAVELSANINNLIEATPYFFRLIAKIDNLVESEYTQILKIITLPEAPTNLGIKNKFVNKTLISWKDNSNGEKAYQIFQKKGETFEKIGEIEANSTEFLIDQLQTNTKYFIKIAAFGEGGLSDYSEIIEVETLPITNIEQENLEKSISIFPNPSSEILHIKSYVNLPKNTKFKIYSVNGRLVLEKIYPNFVKGATNSITISDLKAGAYLLEIQHDKGKIIKKFLKN